MFAGSPAKLSTSFGALRPFVPADAAGLARHADNPRIWANLRDAFPHPYRLEDAQAFLARTVAEDPPTILALSTLDEVIGAIGIVRSGDIHRFSAELGYWLAEPYWGRGYMTEAVRVFCPAAFATFGLVRLFATVLVPNRASARVLEKAEFTLEGRMRCAAVKAGVLLDQMLYARLVHGKLAAPSTR